MENVKRSTKRFLSVVLAALLLLTAIPLAAPLNAEAALNASLTINSITRDSETQITVIGEGHGTGIDVKYYADTNPTVTASSFATSGILWMGGSGSVTKVIEIPSNATHIHFLRNGDSIDDFVVNMAIDPFSGGGSETVYNHALKIDATAKTIKNASTQVEVEIPGLSFVEEELVMDGVNFVSSANEEAIQLINIPVGFKIRLAEGSENVIESRSTVSVAYGILWTVAAGVEITGAGKLDVRATGGTGDLVEKVGILGYSNNAYLYVTDGAELNAGAGDTVATSDGEAKSYGIEVGGVLSIENATVTATAGDATAGTGAADSTAVRAGHLIMAENGSLDARAGTVNGDGTRTSYGIYLGAESNIATSYYYASSKITAAGHTTAFVAGNQSSLPVIEDDSYRSSASINYNGEPSVSSINIFSGSDIYYFIEMGNNFDPIKYLELTPPPSYTLYFGQGTGDDTSWSLWTNEALTTKYTKQTTKWTATANKLQLNGFSFETTAALALSSASADVVIELTGLNEIVSTATGTSNSYGIYASGKTIEFAGSGGLIVQSGGGSSSNGICAKNIAVNSNCAIDITAGAASEYDSAGFVVTKSFEMTKGTISATGGTAERDSFGGYVQGTQGTMTLSGGTLLLAAGSGAEKSYAFSNYSPVTVTLTDVKLVGGATAQAEDALSYDSTAKSFVNASSTPAKYAKTVSTIADYTLTFDATSSTQFKNAEADTEVPAPAGISITGNGTAQSPYTAYLNGFNFKSTAKTAVNFDGIKGIMLAPGSVNNIENVNEEAGVSTLQGLYMGDVRFSGKGTLNIKVGMEDNKANSKWALRSDGGTIMLDEGVTVNAITGDAQTNTNAVSCENLTMYNGGSKLYAEAGNVIPGGESDSTGIYCRTNFTFNSPSTTKDLVHAVGRTVAVAVSGQMPAVTDENAVKYSMSINADGSDAVDTGVVAKQSTYMINETPVKWAKLGQLGPSINVGEQTGTLTYGNSTNKATFGVTVSGFDPIPTAKYDLTWTTSDGGTLDILPSGISGDVGTVSADGSCTVTVALGATSANAGKYYFTLTSGDTTSKPVTVTVDKATVTDNDLLQQSTTVKSDYQNPFETPYRFELPTLPAGAGYKSTTTAAYSDPNGLFNTVDGVPRVQERDNKWVAEFWVKAKDDGTSATITVPVNGGTNYNNFNIVVTVTARDKTAVTVSGISVTDKKYDGKAVSYTGKAKVEVTETGANVTSTVGTLSYKWYKGAAPLDEAPKDAGSYKLVVSVPDGNDTYAGQQTISFKIEPKDLTAQPKKVTVAVGADMPDFQLEYVGLVSGDTITANPDPEIIAVTAFDGGDEVTDTDTAGSYGLYWTNGVGGNNSVVLTNPNYNISKTTYVEGGFVVRKPAPPAPPAPDITVTPVPNEENEFDISVPESLEGKPNKVTMPAPEGTDPEKPSAGMVPVIVEPKERAGEPVPKSTLADGTVVFLVDETMKVKVVDNSKGFDDVSTENDWFGDDVDFVSARELFTGTTETTFAPYNSTTRAMFATILWRLEQKPEESGKTFDDTADGAYYAEAAEWGAKAEIIQGVDENQFAPNKNITRQELVTMMYRYAKYLGMELDESGDLSDFSDTDKVSDFAEKAMKWAVKAGIIQGKKGKLDPTGEATRAEVAAILHRFVEHLLK